MHEEWKIHGKCLCIPVVRWSPTTGRRIIFKCMCSIQSALCNLVKGAAAAIPWPVGTFLINTNSGVRWIIYQNSHQGDTEVLVRMRTFIKICHTLLRANSWFIEGWIWRTTSSGLCLAKWSANVRQATRPRRTYGPCFPLSLPVCVRLGCTSRTGLRGKATGLLTRRPPFDSVSWKPLKYPQNASHTTALARCTLLNGEPSHCW